MLHDALQSTGPLTELVASSEAPNTSNKLSTGTVDEVEQQNSESVGSVSIRGEAEAQTKGVFSMNNVEVYKAEQQSSPGDL